MRRTYKSKKDTTGVLDHRDVLQNMDEKSSAFDAFYIQNIKQTKRELSCMGTSNHYGVASNRVRKRKFVKRAIKVAQPPPQESLSGSVFLTPDKSIRVNKAPDLFDQLLNSSPVDAKQAKKEDLFDNLRRDSLKECKTYKRKKPVVKKCNFSTDSSESDKENSATNVDNTQNITDIKSHKLLIEKETLPPKIDDSINNIVKKLSLIKQLSSGKLSNRNNNRLTRNPLVSSKSPLCSTPFNDKTRSKSIYNFSPIPIGDLNNSAKYVTVNEEDEINKSIVFIPKNSGTSSKRSDNENSSPILHITNNSKLKSSAPLFSSTDGDSKELSKNGGKSKMADDSQTTHTQISSLQTSEMEPFLGFSNETIPKLDKLKEIIEEDANCSIILPTAKLSKSSQKSKSSTSDFDATDNSRESHESVTNTIAEGTLPSQPFLGFSKVEDKSAVNLSVCDENTMPFQSLASIEPDVNEAEEDTNSNISEELDDTSLGSQDDDRQSLYDTCSSDSSNNKDSKEPVVTLERLNNSLFQKYYDKMPEQAAEPVVTLERLSNSLFQKHYEQMPENAASESSSSEKSVTSDEFASVDNSDDPDYSEEDDEKNQTSDYEDDHNESLSEETISENVTIQEVVKEIEEDEKISFVTTRRRNDFTNNTAIFILDDSNDSSYSESGNDKTVVNQNDIKLLDSSKNEVDKENTEALENDTVEYEPNNKKISTETKEIKAKDDIVRNSDLQRESTCENISNSDIKPGYVLQPGKKWERSLSIYRRMTMTNDHFDQSILEDEDMHTKGRKYRQSVLSTMELQERGSLHNESIQSRRSTFVSKPSRSTIRIVKETNNSRLSLSSTTVFGELKSFLEECDDTLCELSKLSIADDHNVTVLDKFHDSTRITTARDYVLRRCNQSDTLLFDECYPDTVLKNCRKIGEGVYGEVYLWRAPDGHARVMKIVPIAGHVKVNGEHQKDFHEVISEIVIAMELSALRAPIPEIECHFDEGKDIDELDLHAVENATDVFNEVLAVRCVYGGYPSRLLDLWELYDECKGSENDNPAILPPDQQYLVLELANAGQDLESYQFNSAEQAYALFLQVAFALAVGEESYQFEHRDLHWGNILIAPTDQKYATFVLRGRAHRVLRRGVAGTIIDYSLSRVSLPLAPAARDAAALYNDLAADDGLFGALGDYQFEVYRLMRDKLGNDWKNFEPYTNVLWLHYTVDKMITALRYKRTNTKTHKQYIAKLKGIKERILNYGSAAQFVLTDNEY